MSHQIFDREQSAIQSDEGMIVRRMIVSGIKTSGVCSLIPLPNIPLPPPGTPSTCSASIGNNRNSPTPTIATH